MSLNSERFDDDRSEQQDRFDEGANGDPDPRMLSLERFDGVLHPLGESTVVLPDSIRAGSPLRLGTRPLSRQTSRCSSRRSRQTEQCQRLSVISHHRTDEILSAIIDDELAVRNKFAGERRSGRDPTRRIEEVLYADAATIRSHLEQKRMQVRADSEAKANQAGATAESNRLLLRKLKRGLLQQFRGQSTDGILSRDGFEALLDLLGIVRRCRPGSRASRLRARFWSVVTGEPDCRLDGVTFAAFYRYGIVIAFPLLFRLLLHDRTELRPIEQQIVEEASMLPGRRTTDLAINVFDRGLDPHFLSGLGRSLIDNANLIRLLYPGRSQPTSSSDDELVFRPEITPRSESLARRQRQQSGWRRFTDELQQHARECQRRRDADKAKKYETELVGCTFRPALNRESARDRRRSNTGRRSRFEQLYEIGVHLVEDRRRQALRTRSESPVPYHPFQMRSVPAAVTKQRPMPRGYQETVARSRRAFRQRLRQKAEHDGLGQQFVERYDRRERRVAKHKEAAGTGRPDRYAEWYARQLRPRMRPDPLLFVDINVGRGRTGRIAIYEDSDADVLGQNFARLFKLDAPTQTRLTTLLRQRKVAPGVAPSADAQVQIAGV